jgi:hypothetical protein
VGDILSGGTVIIFKKTTIFGCPSHRPSHPQDRGIDGSNKSHDHARLQGSKETDVNIYKLFLRRKQKKG